MNRSTVVPSAQRIGNYPPAIADALVAVAGQASADLDALSAVTTIPIDLKGAILAAGTPLAAYAGAAPGITLNNSKAMGVRWKGGTLTAIWSYVDLPTDLDPTYPVTLILDVSKSGATATDVASMTVTAFAQTVGALEDADTNRGGVSPALSSAQAQLAAKTVSTLRLPIYLPPTPPARLSLSFVPSGTLATDDLLVCNASLEYTSRPATPRFFPDFKAAILAAGTPMAAWANNAGASAPGITLDNAKAVGIRWNNQATQTAVFSGCEIPLDMDVTRPCVLVALASKSGATVGDATTFDVGLFQQVAGALEDATAGALGLGGTTTALVGNATAKTVGKVVLGIAPNVFTAGAHLTVSVKPTDGTLGTDDGVNNGFWIEYTRRAGQAKIASFALQGAILAAGTPMAAFADNAGASAPGVTLNNSKAMGLRWNNQATQTKVFVEVDLPSDFDVTKAATVVVHASKSGATLADATTFDVALFEQVPGSLEDAGPTLAGTTSAVVGNLAAKTISRLTLSIPANTFSAAPARLTLSLKPTDGTLGTDDVLVSSARIEYP